MYQDNPRLFLLIPMGRKSDDSKPASFSIIFDKTIVDDLQLEKNTILELLTEEFLKNPQNKAEDLLKNGDVVIFRRRKLKIV